MIFQTIFFAYTSLPFIVPVYSHNLYFAHFIFIYSLNFVFSQVHVQTLSPNYSQFVSAEHTYSIFQFLPDFFILDSELKVHLEHWESATSFPPLLYHGRAP